MNKLTKEDKIFFAGYSKEEINEIKEYRKTHYKDIDKTNDSIQKLSRVFDITSILLVFFGFIHIIYYVLVLTNHINPIWIFSVLIVAIAILYTACQLMKTYLLIKNHTIFIYNFSIPTMYLLHIIKFLTYIAMIFLNLNLIIFTIIFTLFVMLWEYYRVLDTSYRLKHHKQLIYKYRNGYEKKLKIYLPILIIFYLIIFYLVIYFQQYYSIQ